jgi:hypothetical protein
VTDGRVILRADGSITIESEGVTLDLADGFVRLTSPFGTVSIDKDGVTLTDGSGVTWLAVKT